MNEWVNDYGYMGFNGVTMPIPESGVYSAPGEWLNLCAQVNYVTATLIYNANGVTHYNGPHNGLKPLKNKKNVLKVILMKNLNARVADVSLLTRRVSESELTGFTSCRATFADNLLIFGPGSWGITGSGSWGITGSERNVEQGVPLFVPRDGVALRYPEDFCSKKKTLLLPANRFTPSADMCRFFGKKARGDKLVIRW